MLFWLRADRHCDIDNQNPKIHKGRSGDSLTEVLGGGIMR